MKARMIGTMLAAAVAVPGSSRTSEPDLRVRVYDYANLSAPMRKEMRQTAERVLRMAGVAPKFIDCYIDGGATDSPGCVGLMGPAEVMLRIFRPKPAMKGEQLGYAAMTAQGGACITAFADPGRRRARVGALSDGVLLGHAVAHEVGHLLLGASSHSSAGIMRPFWRPVDEEWMAKGVLVFGGGEADRMRAALAAGTSER